MIGQSLASMYLVWEALSKFVPDLYIGVLHAAILPPLLLKDFFGIFFLADTMGYAFTFHVVAWLTGIPTGAYVHYPTISTDMLARVQSRRTTYANSEAITSSTVLSRGKLL